MNLRAERDFPTSGYAHDLSPALCRRSHTATPLVAFDLLTTGQDQDIIEIGAVRYEHGAEVAHYATYVNPGREVSLEELEGHGISPLAFAGAPGLAEVVPSFAAFLGNAVLAAHRDSFNMWALRRAYKRVNASINAPTIDTHPFARRLFVALRTRHPYPDYLLNDFIVPDAEPFRAIESARLCGEEYLWAFQKISKSPASPSRQALVFHAT